MSKLLITEENIEKYIKEAVEKLGSNATNTEKNTAVRNLLSNYRDNNSFDTVMRKYVDEFGVHLITTIYLDRIYGRVTKP